MDLSDMPDHMAGHSPPERSHRQPSSPLSALRHAGAGPQFRDTRQSRMRLLTQAIESAVIPRMIDAHRPTQASLRGSEAGWAPSDAEVSELARRLLHRDDTLAPIYVESLLNAGTPIDELHTRLLNQAARRMGTMWECDEADFAAVTMGLVRLHRMLHLLDERFTLHHTFTQAPLQVGRILLIPAFGEQHGFGLAMVAQFFRRAGWEVLCEQPTTEAALAETLSASWFDIVGISLAAEQRLPTLSATISHLRKASRNPHLGVMVGGPVFVAQPGRFREVGADATAADAAQAIIEAQSLMSSLAQSG